MARLYLDTLVTKTTRRKIKTALETLPEGLDSVYEELIDRVQLQNPRDHAELAMQNNPLLGYTAQHRGHHLGQANNEETNEQAIELLKDRDKVQLITWLKEYADNLVKGIYFRPRT